MKRGLQIALGILSLIPLYFAVTGVLFGAAGIADADVPAAVDNQLRYLSGVYMLVSLLAWRIIPRVESEGRLLVFVTAALFIGGVGRAVSLATAGAPLPIQNVGMVLELGAPVLILWQRAVASSAP